VHAARFIAEGGAGTRIESAEAINVEANSVTLRWFKKEGTTVTKYKITYTQNGVNFNLVDPPPGYGACARRTKMEIRAIAS